MWRGSSLHRNDKLPSLTRDINSIKESYVETTTGVYIGKINLSRRQIEVLRALATFNVPVTCRTVAETLGRSWQLIEVYLILDRLHDLGPLVGKEERLVAGVPATFWHITAPTRLELTHIRS